MRIFLTALLFWSIQLLSAQTKVASELQVHFMQNDVADCLVFFKEKADVSATKNLHNKDQKAQLVFEKLQQTATKSQKNALQLVSTTGKDAQTLLTVNALAVRKADLNLILALAALPEVLHIAHDPWIHFQGAIAYEYENTSQDRNAIEWGLQKIKAPSVWNMGYHGEGIIVGGADTGYFWDHPAIKNQYRGYNATTNTANHNFNWHDAVHEASPINTDSINPCGFSALEPCDDGAHGTHTIGTMVGDDGAGNQIGVAPAAQWIGCRNMDRGWGRPSNYLECFDFFLAPTDLQGQNPDPTKSPHIINNSYYCNNLEGCTNEMVARALIVSIDMLKAAGTLVVVSNGNFGWNCESSNFAPTYGENSFSVGATDNNDYLAYFSSKGGITYDSSYRIKPNVVGPGVRVRSCIRRTEYVEYDGTSMSGPHVVGAAALIFSANPDLIGEVEIVETMLEQTAVPYFDTVDCSGVSGLAHPNNAFGYGRIDVLEAVKKAVVFVPTHTPSAALDVRIAPNPNAGQAFVGLVNLGEKAIFEVFSSDGRLVFTKEIMGSDKNASFQMDLPSQVSGICFWKMQTESGRLLNGRFVTVKH